jgi:3-oxoacyl-(acyl-carrier-protein) synthase
MTHRSDPEPIVVTGVGAVSPFGVGAARLVDLARRGESAVREIGDFDVVGCRCRTGARVPPIDMAAFDPSSTFRRAPRASQYLVIAADEALRDAGACPPAWAAERAGVIVGTYRAMTDVSERIWGKLAASQPHFVPALLFQETVTNAAASAVSIRWGLRGSSYAVASGNAPGAQVLDLAVSALRSGRLDAVVVGTVDVFTEMNHHDMDDIGLLSASGRSRPFDADRDGFVMGEGAAALVCETLVGARARGARILAGIAGIGLSHDAAHGGVHPEGRGLATAIRAALAQAGVEPAGIDYIGAAANSTVELDAAECCAIRAVFNGHGADVPVSSLKGLTGEAMSASDLFNLIVCIAAVGDGCAPPHVGVEQLDPRCDIRLVDADRAAPRAVRRALAHSYSYFGGSAAAVVVSQPASRAAHA